VKSGTLLIMASNKDNNDSNKQYCILFYKYHPLTDNPQILETYRHATETFCKSLRLTGRILIGLSNDGEGINGTLAGTKGDLDAYVACMLNRELATTSDDSIDQKRRVDAIAAFRESSQHFFTKLNLPELHLNSPNDFKWSSSDENMGKQSENWFPDLNIKIVKEIISSGGAFSGITTEDTSVGYLTPKEWHREIQSLVKKNNEKEGGSNGVTMCKKEDDDDEVETILIDVRNHKECQIGSFAPGISIDPQTKTFAQFPKWVKEHSSAESSATATTTLQGDSAAAASSSSSSPALLNNKRILMYCTGGIRCEKASAYVRRMVPQNKGIYHLKGGIHKYLEEFGGQDASSLISNNNSEGSANGNDVKGTNDGGESCLFVGKNFVFDRRGALDAKGHGLEEGNSSEVKSNCVIGKCQYCSDPYDVFHPENVCTVCREPVLVCEKCQSNLYGTQRDLRMLKTPSANDKCEGLKGESNEKGSNCRVEYHCEDHFHLNTCYFTSLRGFEKNELEKQLEQLRLHIKALEGAGRKGKQKRRTLRKQMEKIESSMKDELGNEGGDSCRHCGSSSCSSDCWGFHGGNTRMVTKNRKKSGGDEKNSANDGNDAEVKRQKQRSRVPSNQRPAKRLKRQNDISEIEELQLSNPPSKHRNDATGLRVPPPAVRILRSGVKGRWCGKTVHWVMNNEFGESWNGLTQEERDELLEQQIDAGLLRINGKPVSSMMDLNDMPTALPIPAKASEIVLRNMDTIERIVHWHEPPISVPSKISLTKHTFPSTIVSNGESTASPLLYCINKPSSVPVYPAGPYYANSLLMMVEAQEGLPPKTLIPLHRIDRATSGVLLCANVPSVARVVQGRMASSANENESNQPVRKLYLARVKGKFPTASSENLTVPTEYESVASAVWYGNDKNVIEVNAPIAVQLESNKDKSGSNKEDKDTSNNSLMHRIVSGDGKASTSRFKLISYDPKTDQSLVSCCPVTGRGHQLRVHLELIGHPIHNDVEYGGIDNSDTRKIQENISAQSISNVSAATSECLHDKAVTAAEVKAAIRLCKCCNRGLEGIKGCFNSAQLLGCGHSIDLHAYKYSVSFEQNTSMGFIADLPPWALTFEGMGPANECLSWIN